MKRQRGRGRNNKPGMQNPNRAYESTGPDIKVRGSAQTILEKYQQLGRDAMASGDRVIAENYLQHAEHYLRLIRSIQPNFVPRSEFAITGLPSDSDEDLEDGENIDNENGENDGDEGETEEVRPRENNRYENNGRYNNNNRRNNNNNNNRGRDRYRNDNRQNNENTETETQSVQQAEPVQNTDNQAPQSEDNGETTRKTPSRVRGLRLPRKRRENGNEEGDAKGGFGDEAPAFLQTPIVVAEAE